MTASLVASRYESDCNAGPGAAPGGLSERGFWRAQRDSNAFGWPIRQSIQLPA
jgi:hypothetical protein